MHFAPFHVSLQTSELSCGITLVRRHHSWLLGDVLHGDFLGGVVLSQTKLSSIPAILFKVLAETDVFLSDGILANVGDEEVGDDSRDNAQAGCDPERVLSRSNGVALLLDVGEDVSSDEGADFTDSGGDTVITTNVN